MSPNKWISDLCRGGGNGGGGVQTLLSLVPTVGTQNRRGLVGGQEDLSPRVDMEPVKGEGKEGTTTAKREAAGCRGNDHSLGAPSLRETQPSTDTFSISALQVQSSREVGGW